MSNLKTENKQKEEKGKGAQKGSRCAGVNVMEKKLDEDDTRPKGMACIRRDLRSTSDVVQGEKRLRIKKL